MKGNKYAMPGDTPCPNSLEGSTKNVGGDKKGSGPTAQNDPFGYVDVAGPTFGYLEHFRQEKYLEEGHNVVAAKRTLRGPVVATPTSLSVGRHVFMGQAAERGAERLARGTAIKTIAAGGPAADAVSRSRPVLAARVAAREAGVTGAERRSMIRAARRDPESARSERRARRGLATSVAGRASSSY